MDYRTGIRPVDFLIHRFLRRVAFFLSILSSLANVGHTTIHISTSAHFIRLRLQCFQFWPHFLFCPLKICEVLEIRRAIVHSVMDTLRLKSYVRGGLLMVGILIMAMFTMAPCASCQDLCYLATRVLALVKVNESNYRFRCFLDSQKLAPMHQDDDDLDFVDGSFDVKHGTNLDA